MINNVKVVERVKVKVDKKTLPGQRERLRVVVKLLEAIRTLKNSEAWQVFEHLHLAPNKEAVFEQLRQESETYKIHRMQGALGALTHVDMNSLEREYSEELVRAKKR